MVIDKLSFSINGGQGGTGQDGGDGILSLDGSKCMIPDQQGTHRCIGYCPHLHRITVNLQYEDYGNMPAPGGNGGKGGLGGYGGYGGLAKITRLDESLVNYSQDLVIENDSKGPVGRNGKGGDGSLGGCQFRCTRTFYHKSERCCKRKILGVCVDYTTCKRAEHWNNDLENQCINRSNGKKTSNNEFKRSPGK